MKILCDIFQAAKSGLSHSPVMDGRSARSASEPAEALPRSPAITKKAQKNSLIAKIPSFGSMRRPGSAATRSPSPLPPSTTANTADTKDEVCHVTVM